MSLKDSWHFVPADDILDVEGSTTFRDLYDELSARPQGGGFFIKIDKVNNYVKAGYFAAEVLRRAVTEVLLQRGLSEAERETVKGKVKEITQTPIEDLVEQIIRESPVVPVHREPTLLTTEEKALQDQHDLVFEVYDEAEKVGWYMNHETVRETTTPKTVFMCGNTPSHDNAGPDNGTCGFCPWPIVGSRKV